MARPPAQSFLPYGLKNPRAGPFKKLFSRTSAMASKLKFTIAGIAWLAAFHALLAYGLPAGLFIGLVLSLAILYWRIGAMGAVTVSLALIMTTLLYGLMLGVSGFEDSIYYRPDEKYLRFDYSNNHRVYRHNVHTEMSMPHGDLRAMTTEDIAEPRRVQFDTDADGFRNSHDYHGQRYLLVGDSFIAGSGNSQEDLLSSQLLRDYNLDVYNLAIPGSPADYAATVRGFAKRHGDHFRVLLFLFEGNDFDDDRTPNENVLARYGRRYYGMFSEFSTYRVTKSLLKRLTRARAIHASAEVELVERGGKKMAYYRHYMDVTRRTQLSSPEGFERAMESMGPYLERVYFIPTKYRVYSRYWKPDETLPNAQWEYLDGVCRKRRWRCTNLTEPLVRESGALLERGEFSWWRDDTHWNRHGIAAAAQRVAADLGTGKANRRR